MPVTPPATATLNGPTSGECSFISNDFTVTLDQPAGVGGVQVNVSDSVGADTITSTPFTIPAGQTTGTFTITPLACGTRSISITTVPSLTINGSPITYNAPCNCPDDSGSNNRQKIWASPIIECPPAFGLTVTMTPVNLWEKDLYCTTLGLTMNITE